MNNRICGPTYGRLSFFWKDLTYTIVILFLIINLFSNVLYANVRQEDLNNKPIDYKLARVQIPFIANEGQADPMVCFYAQTFIGIAFVTKKGEIYYTLYNQNNEPIDNNTLVHVLKEEFVDIRTPTITGETKSPTLVNYYKGSNPKYWRHNLPTYNTISFGEIYECIHLKLAAHGNNVEKLFYVKPGGSVEDIRVSIDGAQELKTNNKGELIAITKYGPVSFTPPIAYQEFRGKRVPIDVAYFVSGNKYGFTIGT